MESKKESLGECLNIFLNASLMKFEYEFLEEFVEESNLDFFSKNPQLNIEEFPLRRKRCTSS